METFHIDTISQAHKAAGLPEPKHPLISLVYAKDIRPTLDFSGLKVVNNLYQVALKQTGCGNLTYGKNSYDYDRGTLVFTSPGQVTMFEGDLDPNSGDAEGWTLAFHPDLLRASTLSSKIHQYSFFNYEVNEALHLSEMELHTIEDILAKIALEYSQNLDNHSQNLIVSNLELLLDYSTRFYDRQFITRTNFNVDIVSKFEHSLRTFYGVQGSVATKAPSVQDLARAMHLSSNYLSDLLKKETGKSAKEHIHLFIIDLAKSKLLSTQDSISEIGYSLGFEYPQHFSSLFKSKTGFSPKQYRNLN